MTSFSKQAAVREQKNLIFVFLTNFHFIYLLTHHLFKQKRWSIGLSNKTKYKALLVITFTLICFPVIALVLALIIYPVSLSKDIATGKDLLGFVLGLNTTKNLSWWLQYLMQKMTKYCFMFGKFTTRQWWQKLLWLRSLTFIFVTLNLGVKR